MRHMKMLLMSGGLAASLLAGCNDSTAPSAATPPPTTPTPPPSSGAPAPATAAVTLGDIFFRSDRNGSSNTAVDTVAVNGTVTWTWATTEALPHSVQSLGTPSFTSSAIMTGSGSTYHFTFTAPGTYQYDCAVHGQMMTGSIVVMAAATSPAAPAPMTPAPATPPVSTPPPGY
jgi:plastocyanin